MEQFRTIGYYIVKVIDTPKWLSGIGNHMLSVSSCLGEIHPKWQIYMGGWKKKEESGFHSFLCNSLHNDLPTAKFNHIGLLENDFEEVVQFACLIEGTGEPVEWIPCRVGKC